ncbi:Hypothetical protein Minf_2341 [Methylacidiphilum infernorum V4]|uniref:Uncharacterized protein n=1 Tax=Methylacidiphilum infernorum (isolate V4) TaxID=481448 RepID=B3E0G6_METI4|nr:Hypothetical protein Minf_2341 [Methylacidiphilum infernorum V4]
MEAFFTSFDLTVGLSFWEEFRGYTIERNGPEFLNRF